MPVELRLSEPLIFLGELEKADALVRITKQGNKFHFSISNTKFTLNNNVVSTNRLTHKVAKTLVYMIKIGGNHEIEVSGDHRYCREIWLSGSAYGMLIKGYLPTKADETALKSRIAVINTFR